MAYTLADARNTTQDKLTAAVIDEFRKSTLLDSMVFDDTVTPTGDSMFYTYNRVTTTATASGRKIGEDYINQEAKTTPVTVALKVFGGSFALDRVIINHMKGTLDHVQFQTLQKVQAARALAAKWFINGDSVADETAFDGLDKILTGSSTEVTATSLDLSSAAAIEANWKAFVYELEKVMGKMDGAPTIIGVNSDMFSVFNTIANYSTQFTQTKSDLGTRIVKWGVADIMDMGDNPGEATSVIETDSTGKTDIYLARFGLDGVHMVTPTGVLGPEIFLPNFEDAGAIKRGAVEMIAAVAVKASRSAAVLRGVKIK